MTLKQLIDQDHYVRCQQSSIAKTHGPSYIPKEKFTDKDEKGLMKCIERHCELTESGMFWRTPNKSSQVGTKAKIKKGASTGEIISGLATEKSIPVYGYSSGTNGMSDMAGFFLISIHLWFVPVCVALEIKIPGDTQKEDQKKFEAKVNKAGGWYVIVSDFNSYIAAMNMIKNNYVVKDLEKGVL